MNIHRKLSRIHRDLQKTAFAASLDIEIASVSQELDKQDILKLELQYIQEDIKDQKYEVHKWLKRLKGPHVSYRTKQLYKEAENKLKVLKMREKTILKRM